MNRNDYILIASVIDSVSGIESSISKYELIRLLSIKFKSENVRFNPALFKAACYASDSYLLDYQVNA